jgi:CheY-like chemotaxis protein
MKLLESHIFKFKEQELPEKLLQLSQESLTGYWLFEFPSFSGESNRCSWYLGLFQGQVVFAGNQQLCWQELLRIFQRYLPRLQKADVRQVMLAWEQQFMEEKAKTQSILLLELLDKLQQMTLITREELREALRLRILSDFDTYLFNYPGQAQFLSSSPLDIQTPLGGFDVKDLLSQAQARQTFWHKLKVTIGSLESVPVLNAEVVKSANLNSQQQLWLQTLTAQGKTLNEIASSLGQDSLEVAKIFASLIGKNLVKMKSSTKTTTTEVFVVDDSPLILKQFESLVTSWGYSVRSFQDPTTVIQAIKCSKPAVFFLDINMPGITGFDLVKEIRRQHQLVSVPIIMLTAEQTLTNNWRAKWSGCQFLNKPLTPQDVPKFKNELRILLAELLLEQSIAVEGNLGYQT